MFKAFVTTCVSMACVAAMTAGGGASTLDKRTLFTFNKPIALPHMTLPSGTYMFRLASPMSAENFIEVADARGLESYGVFMTRQIMRDRGAKEAVTFKETAPGRPMAVEAWWYSGDKYGYEFIYGKDSMPVAVATADVRQPDIVMSSLAPLAVAPPPSSEVISPAPAPVQQTPSGAVQPAPRTDPAPAPAPAPAAAARTELPRTAGPLPIAFLAGFGALALGFAMSRRRRVRVRS